MRHFPSIPSCRCIGWLRHGVPLVLGILVAVLLGLAWLGFPGFMTQWILATANEGDYFITASRVKLDLRGGLDASDVMVYRKGVTGPPLLETRRMQVLYHLFEPPRAGRSRVKELRASHGVIRPLWARSTTVQGAAMGAGTSAVTPGPAPAPAVRRELNVILSDFDVLGVRVGTLGARVSTDGEGVRLSGLAGEVGRDLQRGSIGGNLAWDYRQKARGHLVTSFDPHALAPLCTLFYPAALPVLDLYSFPSSPPRLDLGFEADWGSVPRVSLDGKMTASQFSYRGAGIGFANVAGSYTFGNGVSTLKLDPFLMVVRGRKAQGKAEYDFMARTSSFELVSEIDLAAALRVAGVREQALESWQFEEGARIVAKGTHDFQVPGRSRIDATVEGAKLGYGSIQADECSLRFRRNGLTNLFSEVRGKLGGGSFSGTVSLEPGSDASNRITRARAEIIHADADEVVKILSSNQVWRTAGKLYGTVEWTLASGSPGSNPVSAEGQLTLRNARGLGMPLFGGLQAELARLAPGVDFSRMMADARFSFKLVKGRVESQDLTMDCGPVVLAARGGCGLDGTLDFIIEVRMVKKPGGLGKALAALLPSGSPLEFMLQGTLDAPRWSRLVKK